MNAIRLFVTLQAYTDYDFEADLQHQKQIALLPLHKGCHKRQHAPEMAKAFRRARKRIETTLSEIAAKLPHRLNAVTAAGFESKILAIFVAYAILAADKEKMADIRRVAS